MTRPADIKDQVQGISPFVMGLRDELRRGSMNRRDRFPLGDLDVEVTEGRDAVWAIIRRKGRGGLAVRTAYIPGGNFTLRKQQAAEGVALDLTIESPVGQHRLCLTSSGADLHRLRIQVFFTPAEPMRIPFVPRDLYPLDENDDPTGARGNIEAAQRGVNSGLVYFRFDEPNFGNVLYFQNLTSLNPYFLATGTKPDGVVGGTWPELGFALPTPETQDVEEEKILPAGQEFALSDAIIVIRDWAGDNEQEMARQFLQMLAVAYKTLDVPEVEYRDWVKRSEHTLRDIEASPQARRKEYGHLYLMPYP